MRASILIVNYSGGRSLLENVTRLVRDAETIDAEIVVWDNASPDRSGERLAASNLPVRVLRSNENLGYAGGMNGAAATARGKVLVLMNPDAVPRAGALERLVSAVESDPAGTLFGGVVLRAGNTVDTNCHRALPTLDDISREARFQRPRGVIENEANLHDPARSPVTVPAISGAVMALGRETRDKLGPLDDGFFLYHEDTEWCRRAHEKGLNVAVVPGALFEHAGGASTGLNEGPPFEARLLSDFRYHAVLDGRSAERVADLWKRRLAVQHALSRVNALLGIRGSRERARHRASIYWLLRDALENANPNELADRTSESSGTRPGNLVDWPSSPAPGEKPRVVSVLPDLEIGGAQKLVEEIVRETSDEFYHLVVRLKSEGPLDEAIGAAGVEIRSPRMTAWRDRRSITRAGHYLSLVHADLFHSHLLPSEVAMRSRSRAAFKSRVPWITTKHSVDARFGFPARLIERWAVSRADAVYAVSRAVAREKSYLGKHDTDPVVLTNPPSVRFAGADAAPLLARDKVRVLAIGRLHAVKKTERFLETARILSDRAPGRYEFRVVGSGPEEERLRETARHIGLGDALAFAPSTDDVPGALDNADFVLFFSEAEGHPIIVLDTIARQRIPIVRRAAGAAEALPSVLDDCYIDSDSPEMFADAVERFANDPRDITARVAEAADELRARKPYSAVVADQYRKWIEQGRRTRVLHVITRMILGGAQQNTLASVARVDPARFDSDLWTGPQTGSEGDLRAEAERIGVLMVYFRNVVRELNPVKDLVATCQLYRMMRKRRYDIVHTHSSKIGILGRIAAHFAGVPHVVHTAHGWGFHEHMAGWLRGIYVALEKLVLPMTDQLVSVSDETTRVGLEAGIGRPEDYLLIRSGIPTNEFCADPARGARVRETLGIARDRFVIGTVGRLSPQKNPLDFVRVAGAICAKHDRAHFLSIGEGPLRGEVEAAIRDAGLEDRVTLLGLRTDVPDLMRAMDLYVMTSLWEGLPRVVVQALATGVPVISYDVAGTKEIVREGKNGYLVAPGDWRALASRIDEVLRDDTLYAGLRRVSANEFDTSFTEDRMIADLEELYERLMKKNGA